MYFYGDADVTGILTLSNLVLNSCQIYVQSGTLPDSS